MSVATPIPRSTRQQDVTLTGGQTVIGPLNFNIYDVLDVAVLLKGTADEDFALLDTDAYTVAATGDLPGPFTVTLDTAQIAGTIARVKGARVHERVTDVTQGGAIRSVAIERELDRQTVTLQELRRDVDQLDAGAVEADRRDAELAASTSIAAAMRAGGFAAMTAQALRQARSLAGQISAHVGRAIGAAAMAAQAARFARGSADLTHAAVARIAGFTAQASQASRRARGAADMTMGTLTQAAGYAAMAALNFRRARAQAVAAAASAAQITDDQIALKSAFFN